LPSRSQLGADGEHSHKPMSGRGFRYPRWVLDGQTTKFPKLDFLRDSTVQSGW
jgi:hypothetical protein